MDETKDMTVCDPGVMIALYFMLLDIVANLQSAREKVDEVTGKLAWAYEGEAKPEMELFFSNLSIHLNRLSLFYSKMMDYIMATAQSFQTNDTTMSTNMEG